MRKRQDAELAASGEAEFVTSHSFGGAPVGRRTTRAELDLTNFSERRAATERRNEELRLEAEARDAEMAKAQGAADAMEAARTGKTVEEIVAARRSKMLVDAAVKEEIDGLDRRGAT